MKKRCLIALSVVSLIMPSSLGMLGKTVAAKGFNKDGTLPITEENFPDRVFRQIIKDELDTDFDGVLSEEERTCFTGLLLPSRDVYGEGIRSLEGLQYFSQIVDFGCMNNDLTEVDLSVLPNLRTLDLSGNHLKTLDFSQNPYIYSFACNENELTELDITPLKNLQMFSCADNYIEKLDVSFLGETLTGLDCSYNPISTLNLRKNTCLDSLYVAGTKIAPKDYSKCRILERLDISDCNLSSVDVSNFPNLVIFECRQNKLTSLDLSYNTNLVSLNCSSNPITKLDLSKNEKLGTLICNETQISTLNLSSNPVLTYLSCNESKLTKLDVSKNPELADLYCRENNITELVLSNNLVLEGIECSQNELTKLDVSKCSRLSSFSCGGNQLKELDVSANKELYLLLCDNNQLSEIDVSANRKLEMFACDGNHISELDVHMNNLLSDLSCGNNDMTKLTIGKKTDLRSLWCINNKLTSLDLSKTPNMKYLCCQMNNLKKLDISNLPYIIEAIEQNGLKHVDSTYKCMVVDEYGQDREAIWFDDNVELTPALVKPQPTVSPTPTATPTPTVTPTPSPEKEGTIADFVERLYTVALNRASEEGGKKYWVEEITNGNKTGGDCGLFFLLSEEFNNRKLSVEDFVETLYLTFFDRASEPNGKAFWVGQLKNNTMSREQVIRGFIDSTEWCNVCASYGVKSGAPNAKAEIASKNAIAFATRLYTCCLGREAEEGGLKYWSLALTNLEQTGCSAAKEFFTSAEFVNFKLKDDEYVRRLYTTFMDREPKAEEVSYWTGEIKAGRQTKASVLAFFGQSEEFTNICKKYGIDRGTI